MLLPTTTTPPRLNLADMTTLIYGPSKIGKSTWCSQADNALFLATEPGLNALDVYQIPIRTWEELLSACREIDAGKHKFKTIVIDTIDNAYRFCSDYICAKAKIEHESDLGYGKGWALINNEFQRVLTRMAFLPYGLFMVSHAVEREIETRSRKYTRMVPTLPDKARKIVLGMADLILYCDLEAETDEEQNRTRYRPVIRTKRSAYYEAGDRTGRLPGTLDLDYAAFVSAFSDATARPASKTATGKNSLKQAVPGKNSLKQAVPDKNSLKQAETAKTR